MRVWTIGERDLLPFGGDGGLDRQEERALSAVETRLPRGALVWERSGVRVGPFCGVVRAGDLTLEILPKVEADGSGEAEARGVLVAMLRTTGELALANAGTASLGLQRLQLLDVFVLDFCTRAAALLRRGPIRSYQSFEDDLPTLRGRLRLAEQIRRSAADQGRFSCRFDELSVDNAHNRALRAVLLRLLPQAAGPQAKAAAGGLLRRLEEVSAAPCSAANVDSLPFNRLTEAWRPLFRRAAWFFRGLFPDVRAGGVDGLCLLFDMQRLFEAFVGARIRREWRGHHDGARVVLQGPCKHLARTANGAAFRLRPDVAVVSAVGTVERLIDAKWKRLSPVAAGCGVAREDVYQITAYAGAYGCPRVALVYPRPPGLPGGLIETFDLRLTAAPRIEVYALDLLAAASGGRLPEGLRPEDRA